MGNQARHDLTRQEALDLFNQWKFFDCNFYNKEYLQKAIIDFLIEHDYCKFQDMIFNLKKEQFPSSQKYPL